MKNITVSVPDEVYRAARIRAAELGNSVSALVCAYLQQLASDEADFARLEQRQLRIQEEITSFSAGDRLDRISVHDRAIR